MHAVLLAAALWTHGSFAAAGGARLAYDYRAGSGDPVLLVHGLGLGARGFERWRGLFPGRPLMILERRGYGTSAGDVDEDTVGEADAADVAAAIDEARRLSGGRRVGVLGYSWGALVVPAPDPAKVAWVALVCPGVPGLARFLPPAEQALAAQTRYWHGVARAGGPAALAGWLDSAVLPGVTQLAAKARSLGLAAAADDLDRDAADPAFLELYTDESLWAAARETGPAPSPRVPVFVGWAEDDQVVPPAAVTAYAAELSAAGARTTLVHWPGDHLDALADPSRVSGALAAFDAAAENAILSR